MVVTDAEGTLTRRERKKRATRLALKAAALDLVAERGFAHVTVEDIADAVDVSVRTFFNYFASKEAAVLGEDPELVAAMAEQLLALPADLGAFDALRQVMLARLEAIGEDIDLSGEDHRAWARRFAVVRSQPEVAAAYAKHQMAVEQVLTGALVERWGGDESRRLAAAVLTASTLAAVRAALQSWGGEGGTDALLVLVNQALDIVAGGLCPNSSSSSQRNS